jgi:hypothetical protein
VERSPVDEAAAADVALADLPSTSGAHWANRDVRRGERTPFRRPLAQRPLETETTESTAVDNRDDSGWEAFVPNSASSDRSATSWFASTEQPTFDQSFDQSFDQAFDQSAAVDRAAPDESAATSGRASFGVTEEPISGHWVGNDPSPISPATPPQHAQTPMPMAVELPVRTADGMPARISTEWPETPYQDRSAFFDEQPSREIRQHRGEPAQRGHHHQDPPRRSKLLVGATVALTSLVLLGGAAAGVAYFSGDDKKLTSVLELGAGDDDGSDGVVATAPLGNRTSATFELVAATRRATVKTQDLGDELFRITAAGDSGAPRPAVTEDKVQLLLAADKNAARGNVEVLLSTKVTWALRFTGGADEQLVDLTGGKLSSVDLTGASRRVALTLPTPSGTVPLRVTGAIEDLSLASPKDSPVRVQVDSGAKTVAAGTRTLRDLEPGSTLTPKQWKVPNRYDLAAESKLTLLTVRTVGVS